jgi:hypothetical protein
MSARWKNAGRWKWWAAGLLVLLVVGAAAGGSGEKTTGVDASAEGSTAQTATATTPVERKPKPKGDTSPASKERVLDCLSGVGYVFGSAGSATRVSSPGGRQIANVDFFKNAKAAKKFADPIVLEPVVGPRAVAIFFDDAKDSDEAVVRSCVTTGS